MVNSRAVQMGSMNGVLHGSKQLEGTVLSGGRRKPLFRRQPASLRGTCAGCRFGED
jgi:hypothetical protein